MLHQFRRIETVSGKKNDLTEFRIVVFDISLNRETEGSVFSYCLLQD
jgi:hypothetical protein